LSGDVIQLRAPDADYKDRPLTESLAVPPSSAADLLRRTGRATSGDELSTGGRTLPVNLKPNGVVMQLDEGPLDLSTGGRATAARRAADAEPEVMISDSSRLRSSNSQTMTSASLARLVKRFGAASTTSTSGTSSTVVGRAVHDASSLQPPDTLMAQVD